MSMVYIGVKIKGVAREPQHNLIFTPSPLLNIDCHHYNRIFVDGSFNVHEYTLFAHD